MRMKTWRTARKAGNKALGRALDPGKATDPGRVTDSERATDPGKATDPGRATDSERATRTQEEHRLNSFISRGNREAVCKGECWNIDVSRRFYA